MQLSKIKISGFKSFVDPTTLLLPSKLVAIVGPNGCGKSNIIDAITWVMGESSPKYLRGESLTDVIFNGSNARKPVGQASVELIFDNSDGTIGGEYGNYAEISVRRSINRDSDSTYFLNGVRCRKRDVVDLFLGTGLGPRSYSIIGQNMISRIIEAKPDELRTYLEEAAGISKYKERRHETELRMGHAKENLARVNDVRTELEKQLSHLKHQANVAERFKTLKQQERTLRAEWYAIQWRDLDCRMVDSTLHVQREETALEARKSDLSGTDREIEQLRHEQRVVHDAFQEVQRRYYAVGNEITRIEQDIVHHQERQHQWENDLKNNERDAQTMQDQLDMSEEELHDIVHDLQNIEPQFDAANQASQALQNKMREAEEAVQEWEGQWDEFNQNAAKTTQTAQVEKTHIQHLEQKLTSLEKRRDQLVQDQSRCNFSALHEELESITKQSDEITDTLEEQMNALQDVRHEIGDLQTEQQNASTKLNTLRSELQRLTGQQASLDALQQTALGQRNNPAAPWLTEHQLASKPRLAQHIDVEKGWEFAVEKALGAHLQAVCIDEMQDVVPHLKKLTAGNVCVFATQQAKKDATKTTKGMLLLDKVKSAWPLDGLLANIYVAESLDEALAMTDSLTGNESIITKDGVWLNGSWLKVLREHDPAAGIFQREHELKELAARIETLQNEQADEEDRLAECKDKLMQLEARRDQLQQACHQQQAQSAQLNAQRKMKQERLTEMKVQSERLTVEQAECVAQLDQTQTELTQAKSLWQTAMSALDDHSRQRETLTRTRENARLALQTARDEVNTKRDFMHELEIRLQTAKSQKASLQQSITRLNDQLSALDERKSQLQNELSAMPPIDVLKETLRHALDKHATIESELNTTRTSMDALDHEFRNLENKRQSVEREINKVRSSLEAFRVEFQGLKVKSDTLLEQFKETELTLEDVLKELQADASANEWQGKLEQVMQRITRLGPINLVAIEEYATCLERKEYLDKQMEDLQAGLTTLEEAINKIDRETRTKFKETYDKVNARFQELFPTVFGGGKAYLELTSDDLLEAGVTMMACPPGKRNSTIYLLSGGEKSLTAIALIFSIFHLNPAPFCLLDEVDAALDDANVLRFTRLVKVMAEKTQFLFISHNKLTIEVGEHLIGVTMNEPGVSRLVSVDLEKAISLAGS